MSLSIWHSAKLIQSWDLWNLSPGPIAIIRMFLRFVWTILGPSRGPVMLLIPSELHHLLPYAYIASGLEWVANLLQY